MFFCFVLFFAFAPRLSALTLASTVIQNQASATYHWAGRDYGISSNSVSNRVASQYGILITPDGTLANPGLTAYGDPGRTVYFPYVLVNTGNVIDSYDLNLAFLQGAFLPSFRGIYHDSNGNGRVDPGEPMISRIDMVQPGASINLLVRLDIPVDAGYGQEAFHDLRGQSVGNPAVEDRLNINRVQLVYDAVLKITKSPAIVAVMPGGQVDFTLDVINVGSAAAKSEIVQVDGVNRQGVLVSDQLSPLLPGGISYVAGTLTGAPARHRRIFRVAGSNAWRELSGAQETALAPDITEVGVLFEGTTDEVLSPGQQARVTFRLAIAPNHPAGKILNTSSVQYRSRLDEPRQDLATNTVHITVIARTTDVLIGPYNNPDAVGNVFGVFDNNGDQTVDPGVPATAPNPFGTQITGNTVYFLNTVRNVSNAVDTINLTIDALSNLPAEWLPFARIMAISGIVPRLQADGITPFLHPDTGQPLYAPSNVTTLFDTNGDGIPDTGPLAPGEMRTVAVRLYIPTNALSASGQPYGDNQGQGYRVTVRAQSTLNPGIANLTSNTILRIMALGNFWDPFEKDQDAPDTITVGTTIPYVNIFGNNGPGPVFNTIIRDELSEYLTNVQGISNGVISDSGGSGRTITVTGSYEPLTHTVSWHIFEIPPGFIGRIGFRADVAPGTGDGTEIPNVFSITSDQTQTARTSNQVLAAVGGQNILTIRKKASTDKAEIGDPVRYEVEVGNTGTAPISGVVLEDFLPRGFRYLPGTATLDKEAFEPELSADGSTLSWNLGVLAPGARLTIVYACVLTSDTPIGRNSNVAAIIGVLPLGSRVRSTSSADILVEPGIFHNDSVLIGRVFIDQNDDRIQNHAEPGVQGVRIMLEDGTYVLTDREGKYHFSGIKPGMHVLRLDQTTLPPGLIPAVIDSQNAMNPLSRMVELRYGTLHKANFRVLPQPSDAGAVAPDAEAELKSKPLPSNILRPLQVSSEGAATRIIIECEAAITAEVDVDNASGIVHVMLPGVLSTRQPERLGLDDPNVASLRCHLDTDEGRAKVQVRLRKRTSGYPTVRTERTQDGVHIYAGTASAPDHDPDPATLRAPRAPTQLPEFLPRILSPEPGETFISGNQITVTAACFLAGQAKLFINHELVSEDRIGQRGVDVKARRMVYTYYGVTLQPGNNLLRFEVLNPGSSEPEVSEITVLRAASPKRLALEVTPSPLMADGLTEPVVHITLLDENGVPTGHGTVVTITVDKGDILSPDLRYTEPGHQAQVRDGVALIRLSAASATETRVLRIIAGDLDETLKINFTPDMRPWIVTGIASATFTDERSQLSARDGGGSERNLEFDDRIALFAKGTLPHNLVLTTSYDSKKPRDDGQIFGEQDPLKYYPVYGDESEQKYEAESRDKLFIKLERDQSFLMYGDYDTNLDKAQLAAYRRTMTGAKLHTESTFVDVDAFFSRNDQAQVKGLEIQGRGVSGYYTLPDKNIIYNSERVVIETRDRWHPDKVLKSESMARFTDYSIDYSTGRILFKRPVLSRDEDNNPIFIVVDYEIDGRKSKDYNTYGGRVQLHNEARTMYLGLTHIQDESAPNDHVIQGVDASIELMPGLTLGGEIAQSRSVDDSSGSALRLDLEGTFDEARYRLYYRKIGSQFDNSSMSGDQAGRTTLGFEGEFDLNQNWSTKEEFYVETDTKSDRKRHVAIHDFIHKKDNRELQFGLGYTEEEDISRGATAGERLRSPFVRVGSAFDLSQNLRLELFHQQAFGDLDTSQATRSTADLRYALNQHTDLLAGVERREVSGGGADFNLTAGMEIRLNESVSAFNRYKLEDSASGQRVRSGTGLDVKHQLTPEWRLGGTAEVSHAVKQRGDLTNDDFWALTLSSEYQPSGGSGTAIARFEVRDEDTETSYLTEVGGTLKLGLDHTLFGRNIVNYIAAKDDSKNSLSLDFLVGWAYRPVAFDRLNVIGDIELKHEKDTDVADWGRLNRLILSVEANWQPVHRLTLEGKYACKQVSAGYLDSALFSDVKAVAARVDLSDRFFVSAGARLLSQYDADAHTVSYGFTFGVNVAKDVRVAVGYNFDGFKDRDFSRGDHWDKGFFLAFHWKFDESIFGILGRMEGKSAK